MLVPDHAVGVDEVERRPVVVVEGAPDRVVVVDARPDSRSARSFVASRTRSSVVLERELRRVDSDDDQPVISVRLRPRTDVAAPGAAS